MPRAPRIWDLTLASSFAALGLSCPTAVDAAGHSPTAMRCTCSRAAVKSGPGPAKGALPGSPHHHCGGAGFAFGLGLPPAIEPRVVEWVAPVLQGRRDPGVHAGKRLPDRRAKYLGSFSTPTQGRRRPAPTAASSTTTAGAASRPGDRPGQVMKELASFLGRQRLNKRWSADSKETSGQAHRNPLPPRRSPRGARAKKKRAFAAHARRTDSFSSMLSDDSTSAAANSSRPHSSRS